MLKQHQIPFWITSRCTEDANEALQKVKTHLFQDFWKRVQSLTYASGIESIVVVVNLMSPGFRSPREKPSYVKKLNVQFVDVTISHNAWTGADWPARVDLLTDAIQRGIKMIRSTRVTEQETSTLLASLESSRIATREHPPLN